MDTADMFFICMMLSLNTVLTAVTVVVLLHGNTTRKNDSGYVDMNSFPSDFRNDNNYNDKKRSKISVRPKHVVQGNVYT